MKAIDVLRRLEQPRAHYAALTKAFGAEAGLLLGQLIYWQGRGEDKGWVYKTSEEIWDECGINYAEQRVARKRLKAAAVLREREDRANHRVYFLVDVDAFERVLDLLPGLNSRSKMPETRGVGRRLGAPGGPRHPRSRHRPPPPTHATSPPGGACDKDSHAPGDPATGGVCDFSARDFSARHVNVSHMARAKDSHGTSTRTTALITQAPAAQELRAEPGVPGSARGPAAEGGLFSDAGLPAKAEGEALPFPPGPITNHKVATYAKGDAVVGYIPLKDGTWAPIGLPFAHTLVAAYPSINVKDHLKRFKAWCVSNPSRRKTPAGLATAINAWMDDKQDKADRVAMRRDDDKQNGKTKSSGGYLGQRIERATAQQRGWGTEFTGAAAAASFAASLERPPLDDAEA